MHAQYILVLIGMIFMSNNLMYTTTYNQIHLLQEIRHPFDYDLAINIVSSNQQDAPVMICCHGYGHNNEIAEVVAAHLTVPYHLVSFNFPDHDITNASDHTKSTFGSIDELLPLLYVMKRCIVDCKLSKIGLYGFSAGGGAIINALAVLQQGTYKQDLQTIGITEVDSNTILKALERGIIILECPLKSIEEIIAARGPSRQFTILAQRYANNHMRPIDIVSLLDGIKTTIFLHFENPDDILGNKDDHLFADRLITANKGTTIVTIGYEGGHNNSHKELWKKLYDYFCR
jgi:hypothetical protein